MVRVLRGGTGEEGGAGEEGCSRGEGKCRPPAGTSCCPWVGVSKLVQPGQAAGWRGRSIGGQAGGREQGGQSCRAAGGQDGPRRGGERGQREEWWRVVSWVGPRGGCTAVSPGWGGAGRVVGPGRGGADAGKDGRAGVVVLGRR